MVIKINVDNFDELKYEDISSVSVNDDHDTVSVLMHKYKPNTWEELFASLDDGTYKDKYKVGDEFPLDLGEEGYIHMQIAGFDKDRIDKYGLPKAKVTLICKEALKSSHIMNPYFEEGRLGRGTIGGYEHSDMHGWLNNDIWLRIPKDIKDRVVPVIKKSVGYYDFYDDPDVYMTKEIIWLPSYHEAFKKVDNYGNPSYKELFDCDEARIKHRVGETEASSWWLRSARNAYAFYHVFVNGKVDDRHSDMPLGVVFGFCVD